MVIKTWSQPIHEHQEGEVSRERTYLEQFFIFPGNLSEFSYFVDYVFKKLHGANREQPASKYDEILRKYYHDEFEFDAYDLKKGQAPSKKQFELWSSGVNCSANEKYTWKQIRTSFRNDVFQSKKEDVQLIVANALVKLINTTLFLNEENEKIVKKEKLEGKFTSNKSESANKANKANVDTLLALQGEDTKTVKADVNLNAEIDGKVNAKVTHQTAEMKAAKLKELKEKMKEMTYD